MSVSYVSTIFLWVIKVCICKWELCYHKSKLHFQLNAILWTNEKLEIMSVVLAFADRAVPVGSFCWVSVLVTSGNIYVYACIYILTLLLKNWEKLGLYIWWRDAIAHLSLFLPTHEECQPKCECYSWDSWKGCNTRSMTPARSHRGRGQGEINIAHQ